MNISIIECLTTPDATRTPGALECLPSRAGWSSSNVSRGDLDDGRLRRLSLARDPHVLPLTKKIRRRQVLDEIKVAQQLRHHERRRMPGEEAARAARHAAANDGSPGVVVASLAGYQQGPRRIAIERAEQKST